MEEIYITTADIDETFSKIGLQHVAPVLGVPADLLGIDDVRTQQSTWPSYVLGRRSWAENLHFPLADYEIRKAGEVYGARVPAGTLLNPLQHSYNTTLTERRDGTACENQTYCLTVDVEQQTWSTTRSRASAGETELIAGLDPAYPSVPERIGWQFDFRS